MAALAESDPDKAVGQAQGSAAVEHPVWAAREPPALAGGAFAAVLVVEPDPAVVEPSAGQ
ncbi:MAG: hypothetical protein ACJ74Y_16355 [Bryobacteraceae bacterium]